MVRGCALLCLLLLAGCAEPEPAFSRTAITSAEAETEELFTMVVPGGSVESATPLVGTEFDGILSREPIPDPYVPDGRPGVDVTGGGGALDVALAFAEPVVVDVVTVELREAGEAVLRGTLAADDSMGIEIRLPHGFGCAVPGEVLPGGRYLVLVWAASEAGGERTLYHGPGSAHAIAPVDTDGFVRLGGERQAVAEILAGWRAS